MRRSDGIRGLLFFALVAAAAAMALLSRGAIPAALAGGAEWPLAGRCILLLGLGETITTMLAARHTP